MAKRRGRNEGSIDQRGENSFRIRYRINGKRIAENFVGTLADARKELRKKLSAGDDGTHVDPSKKTVEQWIAEWIAAGCPGRRKKRVGQRSIERYSQILNTHVKPALGNVLLQKLTASMIDGFYGDLSKTDLAPKTQHLVHVVFNACLATAHRKGGIAANPMTRVEQVPNPNPQLEDIEAEEVDTIGEGLSETELAALVEGFKPSVLYPVIAMAAATGLRRNELLGLKWTDIDWTKQTLRVERALERTKKFGIRFKRPKTARGRRTIDLDDATLAMLRAERAKHQRWVAGLSEGADVDLGLIRLPPGALVFPSTPLGEDFDPTKWRNPHHFTKEFARKADLLGFGRTRFHDLRGCHATALMDAGIPIHTIAQRLGDDPAILLRHYAKRKRTKAADDKLASALASFSGGFLKP
jgi:integrase